MSGHNITGVESEEDDEPCSPLEARTPDTLTVFPGPLENAFLAAFNSNDVRPLLLYICTSKNRIDEELQSNTILQYLNPIYILWKCDISDPVMQASFSDMWSSQFSVPFFAQFSTDDCPLLIGIIKLFTCETAEKYLYRELVKNKKICSTGETVSITNLYGELKNFTEAFEQNEAKHSFDITKIMPPPEKIFLRIIQHLPLNNGTASVSTKILDYRGESVIQLEVIDPWESLMKQVPLKLHLKRICSLQINTGQPLSDAQFDMILQLKQIRSLTIRVPKMFETLTKINDDYQCFPHLTDISLDYADPTDLRDITKVFNKIPEQIQRLEISCLISYAAERERPGPTNLCTKEVAIKHFLLDLRRVEVFTDNHCSFIRILSQNMPGIRSIEVLVKGNDTADLFNEMMWKGILRLCPSLEQICLKVQDYSGPYKEFFLTKKSPKIQDELQKIQSTIQFRAEFS